MIKKLSLLWLVVVLLLINFSIREKEIHLQTGRVVYLELMPVDPRSLMQGDYMALKFRVADALSLALQNHHQSALAQPLSTADGYMVVSLDTQRVASFKSVYQQQKLDKGDVMLQYRVRGGEVKLATNAFFFQEGQAAEYAKAYYGRFRVNAKGALLLESLHDKDLNEIRHIS